MGSYDGEGVLQERGPAPARAAPELAEVDTLVERADLGPGCSTLVTAGEPTPAYLAGLPRRPRESAVG